MASIINASNSSGLVFTSDMSGVLQLQQNGVALPALSVAPAFSAYPSGNQSIPNATFTKISLQNEVFDTNNNFDSTTNYRFTPTVAGYYQFNASVFANAGSDRPQLVIYKNGSAVYISTQVSSSAGGGTTLTLSTLIQANGTTDYFELYYYQGSGGSVTINGASTITYFQGFLARGA